MTIARISSQAWARAVRWAAVLPGLTLLSLSLASLFGTGCGRGAQEPQEQPAQRSTGPQSSSAAQRPGESVALAPTPAVIIEGAREPVLFHVQVAATSEERAGTLADRPTLASDAGVLLVFEKAGIHPVVMEKTLIPLDLIFIGPDHRIVGIIENAKPSSAAKRRIAVPSRYVLEIKAGLSSRHGFQPGQAVRLRAIPDI